MKNIALIGASGFIGSAILDEALNRGHKVKAIVRNPEKITLQNENLEVVKADVFNTSELADILKTVDEVISAYNPGWGNPEIAQQTKQAYDSIIAASKAAAVTRLLIVGGAGTLFVKPGVRVVDSGAIPADFEPAVRALGDVYLVDLQKENELSWTFFSPAGTIAPGERTGRFRLGLNDLVVDANGESTISSADYAIAMVDELEEPRHINQRFTIGY